MFQENPKSRIIKNNKALPFILFAFLVLSGSGAAETIEDIGGVRFQVDLYREHIDLLEEPSEEADLAHAIITPDTGTVIWMNVLEVLGEFVRVEMEGKEGWVHQSFLDESPYHLYIESPDGNMYSLFPIPRDGRVHPSTETILDIRVEYHGWLLTFHPPLSRLPLMDNEADTIPPLEQSKPGRPRLAEGDRVYTLEDDSLYVLDRKKGTILRAWPLGDNADLFGRDNLYWFKDLIIATGFRSQEHHPVLSISLKTGEMRELTGPLGAALKISDEELLLFLIEQKKDGYEWRLSRFDVKSGRTLPTSKTVRHTLGDMSPVLAPSKSPGYIIYHVR